MPDFVILLCLRPDDFTCEGETFRTGKGEVNAPGVRLPRCRRFVRTNVTKGSSITEMRKIYCYWRFMSKSKRNFFQECRMKILSYIWLDRRSDKLQMGLVKQFEDIVQKTSANSWPIKLLCSSKSLVHIANKQQTQYNLFYYLFLMFCEFLVLYQVFLATGGLFKCWTSVFWPLFAVTSDIP